MRASVIRLARSSAEWGIFIVGIVLGLCVAMLAARSCSSFWYYWDGVLSALVGGGVQRYHSLMPNMPPFVCTVPLGLIGLVVGGILGSDVAAQLRGEGPTSARVVRMVRRGAEWGVFLFGIAVGLVAARWGAMAIAYVVHGPNFMKLSTATVTYIAAIIPLGLIGLVGGWMLGSGAAAQLWPPVDEGAD